MKLWFPLRITFKLLSMMDSGIHYDAPPGHPGASAVWSSRFRRRMLLCEGRTDIRIRCETTDTKFNWSAPPASPTDSAY